MGNLSIKKTNEREDRFRRLMEATGENTIAGAYIDQLRDHSRPDNPSGDFSTATMWVLYKDCGRAQPFQLPSETHVSLPPRILTSWPNCEICIQNQI